MLAVFTEIQCNELNLITKPTQVEGMTVVVVVELQDHHWSAWFELRPEVAFGGDAAAVAAPRSLRAHGIDPACAQPVGEGRTVTIKTREIAECDAVLRCVHHSDGAEQPANSPGECSKNLASPLTPAKHLTRPDEEIRARPSNDSSTGAHLARGRDNCRPAPSAASRHRGTYHG